MSKCCGHLTCRQTWLLFDIYRKPDLDRSHCTFCLCLMFAGVHNILQPLVAMRSNIASNDASIDWNVCSNKGDSSINFDDTQVKNWNSLFPIFFRNKTISLKLNLTYRTLKTLNYVLWSFPRTSILPMGLNNNSNNNSSSSSGGTINIDSYVHDTNSYYSCV